MAPSRRQLVIADQNHRPLVIAHRGASGLAPENTLQAFALAVTLEADGVEMDVQLSKDDRVVVIHDARVDRTTSNVGLVADFRAAELGKMDSSEWFASRLSMRPRVRAMVQRLSARSGGRMPAASVPTLEAVLDLLAGAELRRVYVELKGPALRRPALLKKVIALVERSNIGRSVTLLSFDHTLIALAKELAPQIRTAATFPAPGLRLTTARAIIEAAKAVSADEAALHFGLATRRAVAALHDRGFAVSAWTANSKIMMRRLIASRVDAIMTNFPNRLADVMDASAPARDSLARRDGRGSDGRGRYR